MRVDRYFVTAENNYDPYADLKFVDRSSVIRDRSGSVIHELSVVAPENWSQTAVDMLAQKYVRRAGVPDKTAYVDEDGVPRWLQRAVPAEGAEFGRETDARQLFDRIAKCWTYWGWKLGYFDTEQSARNYYDEVRYLLAHQMMAPNSPQWFSTGLFVAYGITGENVGLWAIDFDNKDGKAVSPVPDRYSRVTAGACYITNIEDSLLGEQGIIDFIEREARIFSGGSGNGANYSELRGKNEPLSGGGKSSGLMSFLKPIDSSAGVIKSGGTTRRAARLIALDLDHPDIEKFVDWKAEEEKKVAALVVGSKIVKRLVEKSYACKGGLASYRDVVREAKSLGVPLTPLREAYLAGKNNDPCPHIEEFDVDYEGEAYQTVSGQNANNSVRVTDAFMEAVENDADWHLYWRTEKRKAKKENRAPKPCKTIKARYLWDKIAYAAWQCADPGVQYHNVVNDWNPVLNDGEQTATNPCSEFNFLPNTTCNLACLNLLLYLVYNGEEINWVKTAERVRYAAHITTIGLDITVSMSAYPSQAVAEGALNYRTLGLGYANVGAVLMRNGVPYDSDAGRGIAACFCGLMHYQAMLTSAQLADELGAFPRYEANKEHVRKVMHNHVAYGTNQKYVDLKYPPPDPMMWYLAAPSNLYKELHAAAKAASSVKLIRNAQLTLIQPAGTVGLLMDCDCTGIEPDFALVKGKQLSGGGWIKIVNQSVVPALKHLGYNDEDVTRINDYVLNKGTVEGCPQLKDEHLPVFDCAVPCIAGGGKRSVSVNGHMEMLAAVQPLLSGSSSKTINCDQNVSMSDVRDVYYKSWKLRIKCVALYRDGSKLSQPLNASDEGSVEDVVVDEKPVVITKAGERRKLPNKRRGYTQKIRVSGHKIFVRTGEYEDGTLGEIFLTHHQDGSTLAAFMNAFAKSVSIALQYGVPLDEFVDAFAFMNFEPNGVVKGHDRIKMCSSLLDAVFRDLAISYMSRDDLAHVGNGVAKELKVPPALANGHDHGVEVRYEGVPCTHCGQLRLIRNGTCMCCQNCGTTTGCA